MIGGARQRQADAFDGFFHGCLAWNVESEVAGDGVNLGGIERDAAAIDRRDQLAGAAVVGYGGCLTEKQGQ